MVKNNKLFCMYVFQYYISGTGNKHESRFEIFKKRKYQENENRTIRWNKAKRLEILVNKGRYSSPN